jgi:hypothetical protein
MVGGSFLVHQASATTKPGRHDITELLLKVALSTKTSIKSKYNTHLERGVTCCSQQVKQYEFCIIRGVQCANFRRFRVSYQVTGIGIKRNMC